MKIPIITYCEATPEDAAVLARVEVETKLTCGLASPEQCNVQQMEQAWDQYLRGLRYPQKAEAPRVIYKAMAHDRVVGFVAGHFSRRYETEGELQSIHILKEFQGQGIGTNLLRRLAAWFVAQGRRNICVGIAPQNEYKRFYEQLGARYINEHWLVWDDIRSVLERNN